MTKHYILLTVQVPFVDLHSNTSSWQHMSQNVEPYEKTATHIQKLGENVWLIPRDSNMTFLAQCVVAAEKSKYPYSILFLDEAL